MNIQDEIVSKLSNLGYKDRIVIELPNVEWAEFTDTNSMDPFIDSESNSLELRPSSSSQLKVGDIISYRYEDSYIVHRIVQIGNDDKGWYALTKGDNNKKIDPDRVRFNQIHGVLVAILY